MGSVNTTSLLIFTNQFASMLRSHLPLVSVLENLARETPHEKLQDAVYTVTDDVVSGIDFSDALAKHPKIFDNIYVNVAKAGMISGRLAEAMTEVAEYLNKSDLVQRKLRGALSYPIFMFMAFIAVFNAMVFFILPRFEVMFSQAGKELPLPTKILLDVGHFWRDHWTAIFFVVASIAVAIFMWLATSEGRFLWDKHKLRVPFIGNLWRMAALSRILRTLGIQLHNEVGLLQALELAAEGCGNAYLEELLLTIYDEVEAGENISDSFRKYDVFSGIVLQMISAGEESGNLDELLLSAADFFERLLDNSIEVTTGLINPILTVVIGLAIAGMMVASFLPVFDMSSAIKH